MLLIFDCDGVLVDSELIALRELSAMMRDYGHPMSVEACRDAFIGMHNDDIVRGIERLAGRPLPGAAANMRARMMARLERELKPVDGFAQALSRLEEPRCVASSSDRARIKLTLEWTGLDGFFGERIFSGFDVARGKPAPDLFLYAAAQLGFAPRDCLVIEDSAMGVAAGVAAGMPVVGFGGGSHTDAGHAARLMTAGAATVIAHMAELPVAVARAEGIRKRA